mmetsp:Transcript_32053/g.64351  ORF Transcript_32053/g.64351 Transcript_32053/m.64351 type:complete len:101 (+) Transcript_32053:21-323(+)
MNIPTTLTKSNSPSRPRPGRKSVWPPIDAVVPTVKELQAKYPTAMPYFFTQDPDYVTVKERVAKNTVTGEEAEGVATIGVAVETLRVAEFLTPTLMEQLK